MNTQRLLRGNARRLFLLCLLCCLTALPLVAQETDDEDDDFLVLEPALRFAHLTSDDGLIQNTVNAIVQDQNGFIWFGTLAGLSRYDGYTFTNFQNDPDDETSLIQNFIRDLYVGHDGVLWIASEGGGITRFDSVTQQFTSYRSTPDDPEGASYIGDRPSVIYEDSRGHIWAGGANAVGLTDFDPVTETPQTYFSAEVIADGFLGSRVQDILEDDNQMLWIAVGTAINRFDLAGQQFVASYDLSSFDESNANALLIDTHSQLWMGGGNGLYRYNAETDEFDLVASIRGINDLTESNDGLLWLTTSHGIVRVDPQTGQSVGEDQRRTSVLDSPINDLANVIFRDQAGKLWMGGSNGVDVYDPHLARFELYRARFGETPGTFRAGDITALTIAGNDLTWVAVGTRLHRLDFSTQEVTIFEVDHLGMTANSITALFTDHDGVLWLGDTENQLWQFDPIEEILTELPLGQVQEESAGQAPPQPGQNPPPSGENQQQRGQNPPAQGENQQQPGQNPPPPGENQQPDSSRGPRPPNIIAIREDDNGVLWVASMFDGLYRVDETRTQVTRYDGPAIAPPPNSQLRSLITPPIQDMLIASDGLIWVTNLNGIYRFDPATETYDRFILLQEGGDTWTESSVEDTDGTIWVAARDGLFHLDPVTSEVTHYTMGDGLPTNALVGILRDDMGDLWISSKNGLSRFTPSTMTFRNYSVHDGIQGNEFGNRLYAQGSDGRIFFAGNQGLTSFFPENVADSTYQPQVVVNQLELFNKPVQPGEDSILSQPIWQTDSITLNHDQNFLTFEFMALNFAIGDITLYRYQLEGLETGWNETDSNRRFATYTNLPAGQYRFRVQGANQDGIWSDNEVSILLTVLPPWWETTWFRILAAMGIIVLIFAGYQWRVRAIQRRNFALQTEVDRQTAALQARTVELQASESQLIHARDAAEAANRAKSAFLANMSHELRSPLNAILGFTQLVNRTRALPDEVYDNVRVVLRSGEHLLSLINQVLDLSKIEAGHMALNETDFDLYRMLDDVEDMFVLAAEDKRLTLTFSRSASVPRYITGDMTKLRQTLINLISNAIKFTDSGHVSVRVKNISAEDAPQDAPVTLSFEVEDSGVGIDADELSSLFDAFAQTTSGRKLQEGTGLGLAISRNFVRLMGGDIRVTSTQGVGTTFTFDIVCQIASEVTVASRHFNKQIIGIAPDQPEFRILVVDDKRTNRQLLVKLLEPLGFKMLEAENGTRAVKLAPDFAPHLILMDIRMPLMDGFEATRQIRDLPIGKTTKIVALTASVYDEERVAVLAAGCDEFIRKPVQTDLLFDVLTRQIGVRYVYDEGTLEPDPTHVLSLEATQSAIKRIPAEVIARLSTALELGDIANIESAIIEIRKTDGTLADTLTHMVDRFQFNELLGLLKENESV